MSRTDLVAAGAGADMATVVEPQESVQSPPANPLLVVHSLLRGRYWIAITLATIGLIAGAVGGYRIKVPEYRSTGLLRVRPILPRILYENEQNGVMPMFDSFVESQLAIIQSSRVVNLAMQSDEWRQLGRGLTPEATTEFSESIEVTRTRGSELISISFMDKDSKAALTAAKALMVAYDKIYQESDAASDARVLEQLEERRAMLQREHKSKLDAIVSIGTEFGSDALERNYDHKLQLQHSLESELARHRLELEVARGNAVAVGPASRPVELTPELLAVTVPLMRSYLNEKRELEKRIEVTQMRLGEKHPMMVEARVLMESLDGEIAELLDVYRLGNELTAPTEPGGVPMSIDTLQAKVTNLEKLHEAARAETLDLGRKKLRIAELRTAAADVNQRLEETERRIEQLNVESRVGGRISVISEPEQAFQPHNDKRMAFAAAGGLGGAGMGVGLVLLLGLLDRRVRHISDAHTSFRRINRILGVLPALPDDLSDPEQAAVAAYSVHHIRAMLQHANPIDGCHALAVTSASPGSGKTSLTAALGLSFAAAGSKTLLIDCDIVGGGLTSRMNKVIHRKIGEVLRRAGLLHDGQIRQILNMSRASRKPFGQVAVELGCLTEADVEHALSVQKDSAVGLREVLSGEPVADCVTGTGTPGLFLMPLGSAGRQHVGQLSARAIGRIIEEARSQFDVVIIDTGPILGSLEASMVAMVVDQVVLAVARGEERHSAEQAVDYLLRNGANVAGVVFNRARPDDVIASGYSSSISLTSRPARRQLPFEPSAIAASSFGRLGPIASAVVALTDGTQDGSAN